MPIAMRIERRGSKWVVLPESGDEILGEHDTKEAAEAQLRAIEARKHAMATAEGTLHHDELVGEPRPMVRTLLTVPAWRFSISTGRWDQFAKLGRFEKDGAAVVFDERTLGQIVDNFAARQNDIGMDHEHQALNAPVNGQPAPALAWYSALALVVGGKLARFATHDDAVPRPDVTGLEDGLYGFRARVTPLGEQLLPNYRYISPAFTTDGANEQGEAIGYDLLNIAATNTPFLDGMAPIEMRRVTAGAIAFDLRSDARDSFAGDVVTCPDCQRPGVKVIGISPRLEAHDRPSGGRCPSSNKYVTEFTRLTDSRVPCPLCGGTGMESFQSEGGRDRSVRCRACNGEKQVDEARAAQIKRDHPEWRERLMSHVGMARTSGYVYRLEGGGDWRSAPDDDWETVVATVDGPVVGRRQIDGSSVAVIESGGRIYAALPQNVAMAATLRATGMARDADGAELHEGDEAEIVGPIRDRGATVVVRDVSMGGGDFVIVRAPDGSQRSIHGSDLRKLSRTRPGSARPTRATARAHAMARADIKIERTASGRWRVYVECASGFQVVGEYATEAEAQRAAEEAPARGFAAATAHARRFSKENGMNPDLFKKLGFAEGAQPTVEEKLGRFAQHFASGEATTEELKAMADSLDEHKDHEAAAKMSAHFRRFAEAPAPPAGRETPEEEAKEKAALAGMARTLGLQEGARPSEIAVAFSAKTAPLTTVADLQAKVARLEEQLSARAAAETAARAHAFARQAVADGRTTADKAKLVEEAFVQGGDKAAEALLFQKGTFTVLRRFTAGGEIPGKANPPTTDAQPEPDDIRGRVAAKANEIMEAAKKAGAPIAYAIAMTRVRSVDPELYAAYAALGTPSR